MYGTSGVIHVWYMIASTEMPPPASRQASPAIQRRPLGPINMRRPRNPRRWMDAWRELYKVKRNILKLQLYNCMELKRYEGNLK